jgi:hypothetical protein
VPLHYTSRSLKSVLVGTRVYVDALHVWEMEGNVTVVREVEAARATIQIPLGIL